MAVLFSSLLVSLLDVRLVFSTMHFDSKAMPIIDTDSWLQLPYKGYRIRLTNHMGFISCHQLLIAFGANTHTYTCMHAYQCHRQKQFQENRYLAAEGSAHLVENTTVKQNIKKIIWYFTCNSMTKTWRITCSMYLSSIALKMLEHCSTLRQTKNFTNWDNIKYKSIQSVFISFLYSNTGDYWLIILQWYNFLCIVTLLLTMLFHHLTSNILSTL